MSANLSFKMRNWNIILSVEMWKTAFEGNNVTTHAEILRYCGMFSSAFRCPMVSYFREDDLRVSSSIYVEDSAIVELVIEVQKRGNDFRNCHKSQLNIIPNRVWQSASRYFLINGSILKKAWVYGQRLHRARKFGFNWLSKFNRLHYFIH